MSHEELMAGATFLGVLKELMFMELVLDLVVYGLAGIPVLLFAVGLIVRGRRRRDDLEERPSGEEGSLA